jgi:hypothetical protein
MPQWLHDNSSVRWGERALPAGETVSPMCNSILATNFLEPADLREDTVYRFSCKASAIGLRPGHFPPTIETSAGNGEPLNIERAVFDGDGELLGVLYGQGDLGLEVLVQIG